MTQHSYRLDYHPEGADPDDVVVILLADGTTRDSAVQRALRLSGKPESPCVYVIRSEDGRDMGARCYDRGAYSHTDGTF